MISNGVSLAVISFLGLFYELVFIRWLPGNITSLAYFANIVLISAFFGLGVGYLIPAKRRDLFPFFPPLLLAVVAVIILSRNLGVLIPANSGEWIWSSYTGNVFTAQNLKIPLIPALVGVFLLNALLFVPLGQKTRSLLELFPPLTGYTINILGSIAGIVVFSLISFFYRNSWMPLSWFVIGGLLLMLYMPSPRFLAVAAVSSAILWGLIVWSSRGEIWSPYYVIQLAGRPRSSFAIYVNKFFHQEAVDFDDTRQEAMRYGLMKYGIPYRVKIPQRLLILGAGSGNDAAVALKYGVPRIDAVEIDPEIYAIGKAHHPQRPYDDPRVRKIIDDARSFLKKTDAFYDMVILGTLDSHALLSSMSTIRLDNFVYTRECLEDIKRRLTPEGLVVLMYSVPKGWLGQKLVRMAASVFPGDCYLADIRDPYLFNLMIIAGPGSKRLIGGNPSLAGQFSAVPPASMGSDMPSDDWPYLYLSGRRIPAYYLKVMAILLVLCAATVFWVTPEKSRTISPAFLFSGTAFLLLETKSVTTLSLLFGSTWTVNAFVFLAILVMILLANLSVAKGLFKDLRIIGACLFASLALNYVFPLGFFLRQASLIKWLVPSFIIAVPIYFGSILFARLLVRANDIRMIYGSNLIGCVLGGFVEYASMVTGLKFLFLLAAACYLLVLIAAGRRPAAAS